MFAKFLLIIFLSLSHFGFIFAGINYAKLIDALEEASDDFCPQALEYFNTLVTDVNDQDLLVAAGDRYGLVQSLENGAYDTEEGAYNVISNPELYELASEVAPYYLDELAAEVAQGTADGQDVTNLIGYFNQEVREDTQQPQI